VGEEPQVELALDERLCPRALFTERRKRESLRPSAVSRSRKFARKVTKITRWGLHRTIFQILLLGPLIRGTTGKKIGILAVKPSLKDLIYITELYEGGKVVPVIDRRYPLSEVPEALRYLGEGRTKGKVVITV
jgi:NADPH:quinone reductase-like Zn-dependent oxidoreductase